jgi:integrase
MTHKRVKYEKTGRVSFTEREVEKLFSVINTLEDKVLVLLALNTGIRREDIVNINIADINFSAKMLMYRERKKNRIRAIPISQSLCQEIDMYIKTLDKKQKLLFPFNGKTAYNRLQRLCERAGIPRRPFHALRSTCVKLAQKRGWTPEQVALLTGDSIRVIQEHYAVPNDQEMNEVANDKPIW